ncbi:SKP1-like protein 4 [Acorus calamus]|uniref:SKP1-like protein n=1 Tax=Acorus calamus TaxID=4465 RepID=A0AAV9F613_ACOCL|nr:SKP1-like protein 4 [Acorus calamus]
MASPSKTVTLKSCDDVDFVLDGSVATLSQTLISAMAEDSSSSDYGTFTWCVSNVTGEVLAKVVKFCNKHADMSGSGGKDLKEWDKAFISVELDLLYDLILAADNLNIESLLDLTAQRVADEIKGKMPHQIRMLFNIEKDFTDEEERVIRRENAWAYGGESPKSFL